MKQLILILIPFVILCSCSEEDSSNSLDRNKFIGNFDFVRICEIFPPTSDPSYFDTTSYIIFIEEPQGGQADNVVIIRNLENGNETIEAKVSQFDFVLDDADVTGTGTLSSNENELSINFTFPYYVCNGTGTRR